MDLFKKFVKRIDDDFGYDNEKLARDLLKIAEEYQALQLQQTDVISSTCNDYIDGINMQCARCDEPKYKHKF